MDRSRIAMLIGLSALALVVINYITPVHFYGLFQAIKGVAPWVIFGLAFYLFMAKGGCRGRSRCHSKKASDMPTS